MKCQALILMEFISVPSLSTETSIKDILVEMFEI